MLKLNYKILKSKEEIKEFADWLLNFDTISFDTETTGLATHAEDTEVVGLGFCVKEGEAFYIPVNCEEHGMPPVEIMELFKDVLQSPSIFKVGQNLKYDARICHRYGIILAPIKFDTFLASYCLYSDRMPHGLDHQVLHHFNTVKTRTKEVIPKKKAKETYIPTMKDADITLVGNYCMEDVDYSFRLYKHLANLLELPQNNFAKKLFYEIELPLLPVIIKMECTGVRIDETFLDKFKQSVTRKIDRYTRFITAKLGRELQITKTEDVAKALYEELKLDEQLDVIVKLTKTGKKSTGAPVLEKLKSNQVVRAILGLKKYEKLMNTYITGLPECLGYDGMIHTSFNQCSTSTGRLSCITGESKILLSNGSYLSIEDIHKLGKGHGGYYVVTHTDNYREVLYSYDNGIQPVYKLETSSGKSIKATKEHMFLNKYGWWVPIQLLKEGEEIYEESDLLAKITKIEYVGQEQVYDLYVGIDHSYIANGIVVHNSSGPNLQNIPARDEKGKIIRRIFVSRWKDIGGKICAADMSQAELRILAHSSKEETLINTYTRVVAPGEKDPDVHVEVMNKLNTFLESINSDLRVQRTAVKTLNFGMVYGMQAKKLSLTLGIDKKDAARIIDAYFKGMPKVKLFLDEQEIKLLKQGFTETLFGRRRYIPKVYSEEKLDIFAAKREAGNFPIQGTNADIIKKAMIVIDKELSRNNFKSVLVLQVHDELVLDVYPGEEDRVLELVKENMQKVACLSVPMKIGAQIGISWADAH